MAGIRTERAGVVGTLIIDNPERRNAMTVDMYAAVRGAVDDLLAPGDIRVMILRGAGSEAFGAGSDISEFPTRRMGDQAEKFDDTEHDAWDSLAEIPVPVIAAIHGPCMGGGIAMALHCDIRVAADDATFAVPPARLGLAYPQGALARLVDLVGPAQAKLLLYSARVIDASSALEIGLVQEVVPKEALDAHIETLATQIARLAPLTHRSTKLSVDSISNGSLAEEAASSRRACYASADFREGVQAFLDKRHASFEGR
jgi:enoyl-CoA hydratase/carnithine racemase